MTDTPAAEVHRVFLVGPMGSGKTTIGKRLAEAMKLTFVDSDHEIEARTGASIPLIFDVEGEEGFRKREAAIIDELTQRPDIVLATGGGAVLREENRRALHERGLVIYVQASIETLLERTARDRNRPLLQTDDPRATREALMAVREPLYREVAHLVIETGNRRLAEVVTDLHRVIRRTSAPSA